MFGYIWPVLLIVGSNVVYQLCTKGSPESVSPFASLAVTYLVGAICSAVLYFISEPQPSLLRELAGLNAAPFLLGAVVVGLEAGFIFAYRAGWQVSMLSIVQSTLLAVILLFVGAAVYGEPLSKNKLIGALICLVGLAVINIK